MDKLIRYLKYSQVILSLAGLMIFNLFIPDNLLSQVNYGYKTITIDRAGITIEVPRSFNRIPNKERNGVALYTESHPDIWPSLTITRHYGPYKPRTLQDHHYRILRDYRNVGFIDARLIGTHEGKFKYMPKNRHSVQVSYTTRGLKLLADVTYVSAEKSYYIITFTDTATGFSRNATMRERVLASFQIERHLLGIVSSPALPSQLNQHGQNYYQSYNQHFPQIPYKRPNKSSILGIILLVVFIIVVGSTSFLRPDGGKSGASDKKAGNG